MTSASKPSKQTKAAEAKYIFCTPAADSVHTLQLYTVCVFGDPTEDSQDCCISWVEVRRWSRCRNVKLGKCSWVLVLFERFGKDCFQGYDQLLQLQSG